MNNSKAIAQYYLDLNDAGRLAAFIDDMEKAYNDLHVELCAAELELGAAVLELDTLAGIIERQREVIVKIHTLEVQYKEEKRKSYELLCAAKAAQFQLRSSTVNWYEDCYFKCDDILSAALQEQK